MKEDNYFKVVEGRIKHLIIKRREAHGDPAEQQRICTMLDKLYDVKFTMLQQMN